MGGKRLAKSVRDRRQQPVFAKRRLIDVVFGEPAFGGVPRRNFIGKQGRLE